MSFCNFVSRTALLGTHEVFSNCSVNIVEVSVNLVEIGDSLKGTSEIVVATTVVLGIFTKLLSV